MPTLPDCVHTLPDCHRQIHAVLNEAELAREYASVEALLQHRDIARFVAWVRDKPPEFQQRARTCQRLRRR